MNGRLRTARRIRTLFGWVWIGALLAGIHFLAMAVFFEGSWTPFFWSMAISLIAKWLPHGFEGNRRRIALEAKSVAQKARLELGGK